MKTVSILGSTGSIGTNTVDVISRNLSDYKVVSLTAGSNAKLIAEQAIKLSPEFVAVADDKAYSELKELLFGKVSGVEIASGKEAICEAAKRNAEWVMGAIVGAAGLAPSIEVVKRGAKLALANKETLVCAGDLVMGAVKEYSATLLPVDSEHSEIFQVFEKERVYAVEKIILTASGGPFRNKDLAFMEKVTPEQAVAHPNWSMGAKISVDSATMMNKGLEFIEAYHLFKMPADKIEVVVHPQSVIHSAVAYQDGSVLAQMGTPDMRTPIAYALGWPERIKSPSTRLDFFALSSLTFEKPDFEKFPSLRIAKEALANGGSATAVMNAANEIAVSAFLSKKIGFLDIARVVEKTINYYTPARPTTIDEVITIDEDARKVAESFIK